MLLAQRLHMRYSIQGRKLRRTFVFAGVVFLILGVAGFVRGDGLLAVSIPLFVLAGVFFAMPLFTRRAILKMYAQKPDRDMLVTYEISSDRIANRSEVASNEALWRTIIRACSVPEGFLLYPTDRIFHWLPAHGFQDRADIDRLSRFIESNVKEYSHKV